MIKLIKSILRKDNKTKNQKINKKIQEENHVEKIIEKPVNLEYVKYYEDNITIKEKGKRNNQGNIHGIVIRYDRQGNEIEKVKYSNGICLGNPFLDKNSLEIADELGFIASSDEEFNADNGDEIIITEEKASLFL